MFLPLTSAAIPAFGVLAYYSPYAARLLAVRGLRDRLRRDRMLVLTFDDGPSRSLTPELLKLLNSYGAKASFFMLGRNVRRNADIAKAVAQEGHDVGCHSEEHLNAWKVSPWKAVADIDAGYRQLSPWVPANGMFRPPHGKMTLPTYLAVHNRKAPISWWTLDSGDTRTPLPRPQEVVADVVREGGGIVLMHDLDRSPERNGFVLETTSLLLRAAATESIAVRRLSEIRH
ncbi:MAG TPA: polysaccharide deacetylase family protein [Steroidobacteraceae bacterium]|nr:polysaccharide deacetylase family protein [Steroidobacteraceae bacterium]